MEQEEDMTKMRQEEKKKKEKETEIYRRVTRQSQLRYSSAMVCGAVKYKLEGEGGQMYKEKSKEKEEEMKKKRRRSGMNEANLFARTYVPRKEVHGAVEM